jgi:transcriptional regulator with XRE-family HTH domain
MPADRDDLFGNRVRAARAYKGLSQAQLADEIGQRYPESSASPSTIKRLEANDPTVRGTTQEWIVWVADTTGVPDWFLEHGWTQARHSPQASHYRGEAFSASHIALELSEREPEDWPDMSDLAAKLADFDIQLSDDDSLEDLAQRLREKSEHFSRLAEASAGLEARADYERWLIRKGFSEQARRELLGSPPETMKELAEQVARIGRLVLFTGDTGEQVIVAELEESEMDPEEVAEVEATLRSAADEPLPAPPGELGRGAREHLPSTPGREQSQTPAEPDALEGTGG